MSQNALLDFLQAASNSAASTVSGPVDLIAAGLRAGGVPVPRNAFLSSEWMAERGLTKQPQNALMRVAGETAGLVAPTAIAAKAPQVANALLQAGANMAAPRAMGPAAAQRGAIVWHGSPHKFDAFDSSKIGTGEGAQAYGHGLYLAEDPRVAQSYKEALGAGRGDSDADTIARVLDAVGGDGAKAAAELQRRAQYANIPGGKERLLSLAEQARSGIDPRGSLYKVDLPDDMIARMLDWDAPLAAQKSSTRQAIIKQADRVPGLADAVQPFELGSTTGRTINDYVSRNLSPAQAAQFFRDVGIPGIRYLDGGSRGAGSGTSNFVVFPGEESALRILERNGKPLGR